ncbi:MAG: glutamate--tRNA ligase, partial [Chlamydiia bacterium]|nr:glutamate--tRNA ligase [Chlamydiia bacterium]
ANVVDDHLMGISHVIRGDEWISSTPKHILLYELFGWKPPEFLHMPLLLGRDGKKLSKRKNPTSIFYYRDSGYLKEAFLNFLSLMGYSMVGDKEIYPLSELIKEFEVSRIGISGAFFDIQKLDWINQQYLINNIPEEKLWERMKEWSFNDAFMQRLMPLVHTRIKTFGEFMELCQFFFINHIPYTDEALTPGQITKDTAACILQTMIWRMEELEDWGRKGLEQTSREIAELFGVNHKKIVMRLLFATIIGSPTGPPLFDSVEILGKDRTRARFLQAMEFLGGISNKKMHTLTKAWSAKELKDLVEKTSA